MRYITDLNGGLIFSDNFTRSINSSLYLAENKSIQEITLTVRPEPEKEEEFVLDLSQIPNAFSPNNDGKNDRWEILEINRFNEARIKIFNRWGVLVYKANPFFGSWNGESNTNQFF